MAPMAPSVNPGLHVTGAIFALGCFIISSYVAEYFSSNFFDDMMELSTESIFISKAAYMSPLTSLSADGTILTDKFCIEMHSNGNALKHLTSLSVFDVWTGTANGDCDEKSHGPRIMTVPAPGVY